jgi:mRNA-degrading endonuclease RelE of RelBE toxin-antitoxin system
MKKLRRVTESEVIAEFLKNEFYQEEFHRDRDQFEHLVLEADIGNDEENMLRRALLFRRRGHMWRELPPDTQWWEIELDPEDLDKLRVFPRAHWRKIASSSFALEEIVNNIRSRKFKGKIGDFISKIHSLSYRLRFDRDVSSVILIGVDENQPITIIEGNHRLTAAMLGAPETLHTRFRVFFGISPRMNEVCWHYQSVPNILRYIQNRLKHLWHDPDADLSRLPAPEPPISAHYAKAVVGRKAVPGSK